MSAKHRSLERLLTNATIHATLHCGGEELADRPVTIRTKTFGRDSIEFHTWDVTLNAESGEQSWTFDTKMHLDWARASPVLSIDRLEIDGVGAVSLRLMIHNCGIAGIWTGKDSRGFVDGIVDQHGHPPHRYVIERSGECMQEWWTGSVWTKDWTEAEWFDREPDGPRVTEDEGAHGVCYRSGTVDSC